MDHTFVRDAAMSALILGFFASCWFGWAQEAPPTRWRVPLVTGAVASLGVAVLGGLLAWQHWADGSALSEDGAMRVYGILVGVEFTVAGLGAALLAWRGHARLLAPYICLVVGVHFWPMAPVLEEPGLYLLGAALVVVALAAPVLARRTKVRPSALTGAGAGAMLLLFALRGAVSALV